MAQWALVFFIYSIAGWCWEVSLYLVRDHRFVNRGFLSGPMLPVYGFGAVSILAACLPVQESILLTALVGMLAASLLELFAGWLTEKLFHVRYWDYSEDFLNLKGYICLKSAVTWAVFSVLVVRWIHPLLLPWVLRIPDAVAWAICLALTVFALWDTAINVQRALDMRALLAFMERHGDALEGLGDVLEIGVQERMELRRRRAHKVLRRNPRAVSRRYERALGEIKKGLKVESHVSGGGIS